MIYLDKAHQTKHEQFLETEQDGITKMHTFVVINSKVTLYDSRQTRI